MKKSYKPLWVIPVNRLIYFSMKITVWCTLLPVFFWIAKKFNDSDTLTRKCWMDLAKHNHSDANVSRVNMINLKLLQCCSGMIHGRVRTKLASVTSIDLRKTWNQNIILLAHPSLIWSHPSERRILVLLKHLRIGKQKRLKMLS